MSLKNNEKRQADIALVGVTLLSSLALFCVTPGIAYGQDDNALRALITQKAAIRIGRAKAQGCTRCHGRDGIHHLAVRAEWSGSDGAFAVVQLQAFRDGRQSHEIMSAVAATLTDSDIAAIGLWLDSLSQR